jgi:hypothetical protein
MSVLNIRIFIKNVRKYLKNIWTLENKNFSLIYTKIIRIIQKEAMNRIIKAIKTMKRCAVIFKFFKIGFIIFKGGFGCGKSMLLRVLIKEYISK